MRALFPTVAVSLDLGATIARRNLETALRLEGCHAFQIPPRELSRRLPELGTCVVLAHDLSPADADVASTLRDAWMRFPHLPLFLYVPPLSHVGAVLTATRDVPTVVIEMQTQAASEADRLRARFRELLGRAANTNFRRILGDVLSGMPDTLRSLVERRIHSLELGGSGTSERMSLLASKIGLTLRRIEQVSRTANLPAPRDLLDSITLLWITFGAQRRGISTARFAKDVGISTERLYRMRRRLIRPRSRKTLHDPSAELAMILHQLARRLRARHGGAGEFSGLPVNRLAGM